MNEHPQTQTAAPVSLPFPCVPWSPRPPLPQLPPLKRAAIGVGTPGCLLRLLQAQATSLAAQEPRFLWLRVRLAARKAQDGAAVMSQPPAASPFICTCTTCDRTSKCRYCVVSVSVSLRRISTGDDPPAMPGLYSRPPRDYPINHSARDLSRCIRDKIPHYPSAQRLPKGSPTGPKPTTPSEIDDLFCHPWHTAPRPARSARPARPRKRLGSA